MIYRRKKRRLKSPEWVIQLPHNVDHEEVKEIKAAWRRAGREGVAVVAPGVTVTRLR